MKFSAKKLFLFGFTALLLIGIPISIYFIQQQQVIRSRAEKATVFSFSPESSISAPIEKKVGDTIPLDIMVDPGTNLVSFVKLEIQYDPDKLATAEANALVINSSVFPSVLEGPIYSPGKIAVTLSVGPDPTKAIQQKSTAATITFKALANTEAGTPTLVTYSANAQALSIGSQDQASENVLASTIPATIVIGGGAVSPTLTLAPTSTPTSIPTGTIAPTATGTPVSTLTPTSILTPTPTSTGTTTSTNELPVCSSLDVDRDTTGVAPFAITFTANGTDSDGTISKVTFNFGDGSVEDAMVGGGIGTNTVNTQIAHTYQNAGTYQASAVLTDSNGGISGSLECTQTITVTESTGGGTTTYATDTPMTASATPTIAPTGSTEVLMGAGVIALFLMVAGGFVFFML